MSSNMTLPWWASLPNLTWNVTANCSSLGNFANSIIRTSPKLDYCNVHINALSNLVQSSFKTNSTGELGYGTPQQIASWYLSACGCVSKIANATCDVETTSSALDFIDAVQLELEKSANTTCIDELRWSLGIQGNADIAGVGVMVTFCIEAWLIIAFYVAKVVEYYAGNRILKALEEPKDRVPDWRMSTYRSLMSAFKETLETFYSSSVFLSLGLVTASIHTAAAASGNGQDRQVERWMAGEDLTVYDSQLSALASLFSIQVTFMASLMLQEAARRRGLVILTTVAVLALLGVLLVTLVSLIVWQTVQLPKVVEQLLQDTLQITYMKKGTAGKEVPSTPEAGESDPDSDPRSEEDGLSSNRTGGQKKQPPTQIIGDKEHQTSQNVGVGGSSLGQTSGKREQSTPSKAAKGEQPPAQLLAAEFRVVQTILMGMMLATLGIFFDFREQTINSGAAGDPQLEWSFGQIVVLTTWIPVILIFWSTFFFTLCFEIMIAPQKRMPPRSGSDFRFGRDRLSRTA
ncbi:uncharacterized protein CCOS01_04252 [Colletotrichum costaricense]|uniref:Uncharacterized protein n=1 Tax=Colletotrichum costaricense TaxID=1209916 RepID=A0AAI9Z3G5_9PEZI|nr:uncharacterized protein CCOS01_04252 [Colletotrichum costaricense]KAK1532269.1 hypothetical protein CCOS01_04252 [Colletotrichum costaricense]